QRAAIALGIAAMAGLFGTGFLYMLWPTPGHAKDRLVKAAWMFLVPKMLRNDMGPREWSFLHALAELTEEMDRFPLDEDVLLTCCEEASEAGRAEPLACSCLAVLSRRCIADLRDSGEDPFHVVLTLASECFKGKLPLSVLSDLLKNFHRK